MLEYHEIATTSKSLLDLFKEAVVDEIKLQKIYSTLQESKRLLFGDKLFLSPKDVTEIFPRTVRHQKYKQLEAVNVATFAYLYHQRSKLKSVLDSFFTCILPFRTKVIARDINFYFRLLQDVILTDIQKNSLDLKEINAKYLPLDLLAYGENLAKDEENVLIIKKAIHLRNKLDKNLEQLLVEQKSNMLSIEVMAYIRERIERLEHPENFESRPLSYMAELPGARVLIEADLETFETNERQEKPTRIRENDNKIKQESSLIEQEVNEYQEEQDDSGDYEEEGGERHGEEHIEEYEEDFEEQDELEDDHDIPEPSRPKRPKALAIKAQRGNVRFNELSQYRLRKEREAWSLEEIRALEAGLKKYKAPCWVDIKNYVSPDLDSRTNIQIKDKAHGEIKRRRREEQDLGPYKYVRLRK